MKTDNSHRCWIPLYTKPRHEKQAYKNLLAEGYEAYLPLQKSKKKWNDRTKIIEEPLIKSYVFARLNKLELYNVISLKGISRYISFNGRPAIIRDNEIESLKKLINTDTTITIDDGLPEIGKKVKILSGPLAGFEGEIIDNKSKNNLILRLESIGKSLLVTIETGKLIDLSYQEVS